MVYLIQKRLPYPTIIKLLHIFVCGNLQTVTSKKPPQPRRKMKVGLLLCILYTTVSASAWHYFSPRNNIHSLHNAPLQRITKFQPRVLRRLEHSHILQKQINDAARTIDNKPYNTNSRQCFEKYLLGLPVVFISLYYIIVSRNSQRVSPHRIALSSNEVMNQLLAEENDNQYTNQIADGCSNVPYIEFPDCAKTARGSIPCLTYHLDASALVL